MSLIFSGGDVGYYQSVLCRESFTRADEIKGSHIKWVPLKGILRMRLSIKKGVSAYLTLPMLMLLSSKAQGCKDFRTHLNPVMLVFIG